LVDDYNAEIYGCSKERNLIMENVTEKEVTKVDRKYDFYCDKCGQHLGTSYEHPDGWYKQFGEVNTRDPEYCGNLCNECRDNLELEIKNKKIRLFKKYGLKER
jgi:predicted Zn-dependent protease